MRPATIGVIASRLIAGGGPVDPGEPGVPWNFTGVTYTPPVSDLAEFNFTGVAYVPPTSS